MSGAYQDGLGCAARARAARFCSTPSGGVYTDFLRTLDLGTAGTPSGAGPSRPAVSPPSLSFPGRGPRCATRAAGRSEEHTSELQSRQYLVCRLLLEKKK